MNYDKHNSANRADIIEEIREQGDMYIVVGSDCSCDGYGPLSLRRISTEKQRIFEDHLRRTRSMQRRVSDLLDGSREYTVRTVEDLEAMFADMVSRARGGGLP